MQQREVTDQENITWTCVQAFAGITSKVAAEATHRTESAAGTVPVVCTPSGQAQTVRLQLPKEWIDQLSDEELLRAVNSKRQNGKG